MLNLFFDPKNATPAKKPKKTAKHEKVLKKLELFTSNKKFIPPNKMPSKIKDMI